MKQLAELEDRSAVNGPLEDAVGFVVELEFSALSHKTGGVWTFAPWGSSVGEQRLFPFESAPFSPTCFAFFSPSMNCSSLSTHAS